MAVAGKPGCYRLLRSCVSLGKVFTKRSPRGIAGRLYSCVERAAISGVAENPVQSDELGELLGGSSQKGVFDQRREAAVAPRPVDERDQPLPADARSRWWDD